MKRLLAMIIALSIFFLSGCGILTKGVTVAETEEYTKITFDNFEGKKKIELAHDSPNEGALYYKTNITSGSIKAFYVFGILWDTEKLFEVIEKLANGEHLDQKYRDHDLTGNYKGCRECHIEPDWLLVYEIMDDILVLMLYRVGSHSELFK